MIPLLHHETIDKFRENYHDHIYTLFRIFIGLLFMQHGAQKLFGVLGGNVATPFSKIWFAGIIEFFGGFLVAVGLLTTIVAGIAALEMLYAYLTVHVSNFPPIVQGGGELALVYFAAFLFIAVHGPNRFSLDARMCGEC